MARLVYFLMSGGGVQGGHKIILRHVEALCALGFNAVCYGSRDFKPLQWLSHAVPVEMVTNLYPGDIIILPEDGVEVIRQLATRNYRTIVMMQNQYYLAANGIEGIDLFNESNFPEFFALGRVSAALVGRIYPSAKIEVIPCFADERVFQPGPKNGLCVAYSPRKRPVEARAIKALLPKLHPRHADIGWTELVNVHEAQMAQAFAASALCLSLSRLESVGMTPIEAMACGCVCAGFTGIGGVEYATPANGFWVAEDDCEAATDALARAADLVRAGGPPLQRHLEAGYETARKWSYANFKQALEEVWMRLAPDARLHGPRVG